MSATATLGSTLLAPEHDIQVDGLALRLAPGVFPPDRFPSTGLLLAWMQEHVPNGARILELGTGCGAIAIALALRRGATGVAGDISRAAVDNARSNVDRHGVAGQLDVLVSDVFSGLPPGGRQFDVIFWNSPFMFGEAGDAADEFQDPGYASFGRFFEGLAQQLAPHGRAYLGFGAIGDLVRLAARARACGWSLRERHAVAIHEPAGSFDYLVLEVVRDDTHA